MVTTDSVNSPAKQGYFNSKYDIKTGDVKTLLRENIPCPINCLVIRDVDQELIDIAEAAPLHPTGSLWINVKEKRNENGSLALFPETLTFSFVKLGWHLADKVFWTLKSLDNVLTSKRLNKKHLGSYGTWLRFTRVPPNESWCDMPD